MRTIEQEMNGKVGIVTGGSEGIGRACAEVFCSVGMNLVIASRRLEIGERAANEIAEKVNGKCLYFECDVSDPEQVNRLVEYTVKQFGQLDTMVNNAGYMPPHLDACDMPIESYNDVLATNLAGVFYGCKYAIPHLRETKGSVINMSSILSVTGQEQTAGYSSTKGGINAMTKTIAIEEGRHGVRVNAIIPGHICTELFERLACELNDPEAYKDRCNNYSWLARGGMPEEIGTTALFLASSWAGYITGQCILVSGGMELGTIPKKYYFDAQ